MQPGPDGWVVELVNNGSVINEAESTCCDRLEGRQPHHGETKGPVRISPGVEIGPRLRESGRS